MHRRDKNLAGVEGLGTPSILPVERTMIYIYIYIYIYVIYICYIYVIYIYIHIYKTMRPPGYLHNGFVATHALGNMMYD